MGESKKMNDQQNRSLNPDQEMLDLMRKREVREARLFEQQELARKEQEDNFNLRRQRQAENDKQVFEAALSWQAKCDHRKGTGGKKKWRHIDFMVSRHTFPNGVVQIKCMKCRFKAFPGDTQEMCSYTFENYMKGNKKKMVPNPTGYSYAQWYQMTLDENTTNTETRAEMVTQGPVPVTA
jgi:hypothetical protein